MERNMEIKTLSIDIETYSGVNLAEAGVYRYAESPDFDILLFGVSVNRGPVTVYDLASGETLPEEILGALTDDRVIKNAYNASFERICISAWFRRKHPEILPQGFLEPISWHCTMVWGAYLSLPMGLEKTGALLGLEEQKLKEGKDLIRYFCCPCAPTAANGFRTRNLPQDAPEKWELFKKYNRRDVEVEMAIQDRLSRCLKPDCDLPLDYSLDQDFNDLGIRIDRELVRQAIRIDELSRDRLTEQMKQLTGLENPNSVAQLKKYLADHGIVVDSLGKKEVAGLIKNVSKEIAEVLSLRLQLAKSSISKYRAMEKCVCEDGRCRGLFQFYGASRTGRWAGRLIQLQNLPQNHMPNLDAARALVRKGDDETLGLLYDNIPEVLSELIRTAFIPKEGCKFIVADFSAVEARVLSFLAGETWRNDVFHRGGDIYCESASRMFGVPVEKNGQNAPLRQKGKVAELALGYGGGVGALKAMGAVEMGIPEEELEPLVRAWREANPHITEYWRKIDEAVRDTILLGLPCRVGNVSFHFFHEALFIQLPSGRPLVYLRPRLDRNRFGGESITYLGQDAQKRWTRLESWGPKFVENIVQAICRDLLVFALWNLSEERDVVAHVHDEVILEVPEDDDPEKVREIMCWSPHWLPGIELQAECFESPFYRK